MFVTVSDSSDDYKRPVTANETISEQTAGFISSLLTPGTREITYKYIDSSRSILRSLCRSLPERRHALAKICATDPNTSAEQKCEYK